MKTRVCPLCGQTVDAFYNHILKVHGSDVLDKVLGGELQPIKVKAENAATIRRELPAKVTVYYDGACEPRNPKGVATYGFVVYKDGVKVSEGKGLAAEPWSNGASNNVAEYTAMIRAFEWLLEHGYAGVEVLVRGDSQLSIMQMQGWYEVRAWRIIPLYERTVELAKKFKKVRFEWVPREENEEADLLSELAFRDYWHAYKSEKAGEIKPSEVIRVAGSRFRVKGYTVDLEAYTCECPDYMRSNRNPRLKVKLPCKHIIVAERHVWNIA